MTKKKRYYEIPVFDFDGKDTDRDAQTTTKDASEYVSVELIRRQSGDPELRSVLKMDDERETYRFRINDEELGYCVYQGDSLDDIPKDVQQALIDYGYGIDGLPTVDNPLFLWMEGNEIFNQGMQVTEVLEPYPIVFAGLNTLSYETSTLSSMALARFARPAEAYWDCWQDVSETVPKANVEFLDQLYDRLTSELANNGVSILEHNDKAVNDLPVLVKPDTVTTENGTYLLIDQITQWAAHRFRFHITGENQVVYEGPTELQVPPAPVITLAELGYELANRQSIVSTSKASDVLRRHVEWCNRLGEIDLLPDWLDGPLANPIEQSRDEALVLSSIIQHFEEEPESAIRLHNRLADKYGIHGPDDVTREALASAGSEILNEMPDRFHTWH